MKKYFTKINSKKIINIFIIFLLFISSFSSIFVNITEGAINKQINYQGKLTTSANIAVANGTYNMEFKLYDSGSSVVWTETRTGANRVQVTSGLFSVMLGEVTALTSVNFNQTLTLGVNIGGTAVTPTWDGEMSPRKTLGAVPAAVVAETVTVAAQPTITSLGTLTGLTVTGGGTISGAIINLNSSSDFAVNIGTGTSTGAISIGGGSNTFAINSTAFGVSTAGALSGITSIGMNGQLTSTLASGTAPFAVTSTTLNTNLNADLLDGQHGAYYATATSLGSYLKLDQTTPQTTVGTFTFPKVIGTTDITTPLVIGGTSTTADLSFKTTSGVGATGADMHFLVGNNGATEAMTILNNGNVGIGATSPIAKLQVGNNWSAGLSGTIYLGSSGFSVINLLPEQIITTNSTDTTPGRNIGLALHNSTATAGAYAPLLVFSTMETGATSYNGATSAIGSRTVTGSGAGGSYIDGEMMFYTAPTVGSGLLERMRISESGSVGIGATSPESLLHLNKSVAGSVGPNLFLDNTAASTLGNSSDISFSTWSGESATIPGAKISLVNTAAGSGANAFTFYTKNTSGVVAERVRFDSQGNVGIGATTPSGKLEIAQAGSDTITSRNHLVFGGSTGSDYFGVGLSAAGDLMFDNLLTTAANVMTLKSNGRVGIGTTNPGYKLEVNGDTKVTAGTLFLDTPLPAQSGFNVKNLTLTSDPFFNQAIIGYDYDMLVNADKKYTVTLGGGFSGSSASLFDANTGSSIISTVGNTGTIEVNLVNMQHYFYGLVLTSPWGTGYGFSTSFLIEKYYDPNTGNGWDSNCDNSEGDLVWGTVVDVTGFSGPQYVTRNGLGNGICKIRVTFRDVSGTTNTIQVGDLSMYQFYSGYKGLSAKTMSDTIYGSYDFSDGVVRTHIDGTSTGSSYFNGGKVGIGTTSPTAALHLKAGTATANTAPLKLTSGTNLTTAEAGAMEWDGTNLFITQTTGPTRKTIAYTTDITTGLGSYLPLSGGTMTGNILMTSNKLIGGSTTTDDLSLQTTSGVGATGADMHFLVGNNGATEAMTILNSGNVGIGTTAPIAKLNVSKGASLTTWDSSTAGVYDLFVGSYDGLNFNTTSNREFRFQQQFLDGSISTALIHNGHSTGTTSATLQYIQGHYNRFAAQIFDSSGNINFMVNPGTEGSGSNTNITPTKALTIAYTGNVGIGTTSPTSLLALNGTATRTIQMERNTTAATAGLGLTLSSGGAIAGTADLAGGDLNLKSGISTGTGSSAIRFFTATAGATAVTDRTPTEKMTILGNGNVGIGTTNPSVSLDVIGPVISRYKAGPTWPIDANGYVATYVLDNGGTKVGRILPFNGSSYLDLAIGNWNSGNPNIMLSSVGNVGIGVGAPSAKLHLSAGTVTASTAPLKFTSGTNLTTAEAGAMEWDGTNLFITQTTGPTRKTIAYTTDITTGLGSYLPLSGGTMTGNILMTSNKLIGGSTTTDDLSLQTTSGVGATGADMHFLVGNNGATEAMTILNSGNVGVGTINPVNALDVGSNTTGQNIKAYSTLGTEKAPALTTGNWNLGASWQYLTTPDRLDKNADGVETTTTTAATNIVAGTTYKITFVVDSISGGGYYVTLGGRWDGISVNTTGTIERYITAQTTGKLIIQPSATGTRFTISSISIKPLTSTTGNITAENNLIVGGSISSLNPNAPLFFANTLGISNGYIQAPTNLKFMADAGSMLSLVAGSISIGGTTTNYAPSNGLYVSGNVGIGTTFPTSLLSLGGTAARTIQMERNTTAATAGLGLTLSSGGAIAGTNNLAGGDLNLKSGISTGTGTSSLRFFTATAGSTGAVDNTPTEKMTILGNGNVGIGTTTPDYLLDVEKSSGGASVALRINNDGYTEGANSMLIFGGKATDGNYYPSGIYNDPSGSAGSRLIFQTSAATNTPVDRMTIDKDGNIGIGTTSPGAKLDSLSTTDQLRLSYNSSNYTSFTTNSSGNLTINPTGNIIKSGASATPKRLEINDHLKIYQTGGDPSIENVVNQDSHFIGSISTTNSAHWTLNLGNKPGTGHINTGGDGGNVRIVGNSLLPAASTSNFYSLQLSEIINNDATATGISGSLRINPTLTVLPTGGYRAIEIVPNSTSAYGIYQSGASTKNYLAGNVGIGTTSPFGKLDIGDATGSQSSLFSTTANFFGVYDATRPTLNLITTDLGSDKGGSISFSGETAGSTPWMFGKIKGATSAGGYDSYLAFSTSNSTATISEKMRINGDGSVGIGTTSPTAALHLKAGTATANTAPLKFTSGTLLGTTEAGAIEFNNDAFYGTITTGAGTAGARKQFAFTSDITTSLGSYLALDQTTPQTTIGTFTFPKVVGTTDITTPLVIGGTSTTADLSFKTTSGVGATGADMHFLVGNNGATEAMTILNNGNVGIGTISPTNQLTQKSTTALEGPTIGAELLSSSNWTATNWTGDFSSGFSHTTGNTTALTNTLAGVVNNYYQIAFTVTGRTAGSFTVSFGGETSGSNTVTGAFGPRATTTGTLSITPTTDFDGTIVISIKQITTGSSATYAIQDSAGNNAFEIRNSLASRNNTFVGVNAGRLNITGSWNTAYGYNSLFYNTTGNYNIAIGDSSLYYNNTGSHNSVQGRYAMFANTTGGNNTVQGNGSLYSNTTGSNNSVVGFLSMYHNTTGSNNTTLGYYAGRYIADGNTGRTTGNNGIYIGSNSKASADGTEDEIVIGSNAIGAGSNTAVIGNSALTSVYFGSTTPNARLFSKGLTLSAGTATAGTAPLKFTSGALLSTPEAGTLQYLTDTFYITGTDKLNVAGTSTIPTIQGTTSSGGDLALRGNGTNLTSGKVKVLTQTASTSSSTGAFTVAGGVGITGSLYMGGAIAQVIGLDRNPTAATAGLGLTLSSGGAIAGTADLAGGDLNLKSGISTGTGSSAMRFFTATAGTTGTTDRTPTEKMTILGSGNVGIGATNPSSILEIKSPSTPILTLSSGSVTVNAGDIISSINTYVPDEYSGTANRVVSSIQSIADVEYAGAWAPTSIAFLTQKYNVAGEAVSEKMRINSNGYVGIGTTSPLYKLDVKGTSDTDGIRSDIGFDIYPVPNPTVPTGVVSAGGSVDTGVHYYRITYTTALGETNSIGSAAITTTAGNNTVTLTIPVSTDPRVTGRKLYRTKAGGNNYEEYALATIANNTATSYVDTVADSSLAGVSGVAFFRTNTTSKNITVAGVSSFILDKNVTSFGISSGASSTTGGRNSFFGYNTGNANTEAKDNSAFGNQALESATTGGANSAFGSYSLKTINTGFNNTAQGAYSGFSMTTGIYNTTIGNSSLYGMTDGSYNTALGANAGRYITDGTTLNTTSDTSIYLGYGTKASADNNQNEIVIGYDAIGKGSNTTTLGNTSVLNTYLRGKLNIGESLTYTNNIGLVNIANTTNYTGVATEKSIGLHIRPAFTLTEPASGLFTQYGSIIDMSQILVTAGAGTSEVSGLRIIGNTDGDITTVKGLDFENTTASTASQIAINIGSGWDNAIRIYESNSANGTDYATISAPASITTSYNWTLPSADSAGCLKSNGSGTMSIGACGDTNIQNFASNGNYTIPTDALMVITESWGAGGGGGGGFAAAVGTIRAGGAGGGGGGYNTETILASTLGSSGANIPVTIGTGGTAGSATAGASQDGGLGGRTCLSSTSSCGGTVYTSAWGGAGGNGGSGATASGGGGGGGSMSAGTTNGTQDTGSTGGAPGAGSAGSPGGSSSGFGGAGGATSTTSATTTAGGFSQYGGGGGGATFSTGAGNSGPGGNSTKGGAGGGAGGSIATAYTLRQGGVGGSNIGTSGGGGAAGAATEGAVGSAGSAGTTARGGYGGGGGTTGSAVAGGAGGAGGQRGGGGGGGGASNTTTGSAGGAGGVGYMTVWTLRGSGADLAEVYGSNDDTITPGDVVSLDKTMNAGVKKSGKAYDKDTIGVISTNPGLTIGSVEDAGAKPVLVALSGRVPVKVNMENGPIKKGDYLTSSSVPGVAMKAIKAGTIIGQAMTEYIDEEAPGYVVAFIKSGPSNGITLKEIIPGLTLEEESVNENNNEEIIIQENIGAELLGENVDEIIENKEFITPTETIQKLALTYFLANKIELEKATDISEIYTDRLSAALEIITPTVITDTLSTNQIIVSTGEVISFNSSVFFTVPPLFNNDTAGFAIIKEGQTSVDVVFSEPYIGEPVVNASMAFSIVDNLNLASIGTLFDNDIKDMIVNSSESGFTILINKEAPRDLRFSWTALSVKDPKIFESVIDGLVFSDKEQIVEETPIDTPVSEPSVIEGSIINTENPVENVKDDVVLEESPAEVVEIIEVKSDVVNEPIENIKEEIIVKEETVSSIPSDEIVN